MLVRSNRLVALAREEAPQFVLAMENAESSFHSHSFSLRGRIASSVGDASFFEIATEPVLGGERRPLCRHAELHVHRPIPGAGPVLFGSPTLGGREPQPCGGFSRGVLSVVNA
jgi:hypothetical protein